MNDFSILPSRSKDVMGGRWSKRFGRKAPPKASTLCHHHSLQDARLQDDTGIRAKEPTQTEISRSFRVIEEPVKQVEPESAVKTKDETNSKY